jgi:hypothetical protein
MKGEDVTALRRAIDELQQSAGDMAQHVQAAASAGAGAQTASAGPTGDGRQAAGQGDDEVIDAEFEVTNK